MKMIESEYIEDLRVIKHVVRFSGGIGSWAAAKRVAQRYGTSDLILLFADVLAEDEDLYRFVREAANNVGGKLITIAAGRTPQEVMRDEKLIGNSRMDPCSKLLKRRFMDKWTKLHCVPEHTVIYIGIDRSEERRFIRFRRAILPWKAAAPLCEPPFLSKPQIFEMLKSEGIRPPRLYELGFKHNNCGGACIKAGKGQWARLWRTFPERYLAWEKWEAEMREHVGNHSILREQKHGIKYPLTLRAFRERLEKGEQQKFEMYGDNGGCNCGF